MPSSLIRVVGIIAVLLSAQITGRAQGIVPRAEPVAPRSAYYPPGAAGMERMQAVDPDKKLSPGDQVTFEIVEDRDGGLPRVVTATGDLDVPPVGRVHVAGRTTGEAAADLKRRLEADYYYKATVKLSIDRVSPTMVRSGTIYIYGEVRQVGQMELVAGEKLSLSEAIMKAGGFGPWAEDEKVELTRKSGERTINNVKKIITKGLRDDDPILQDGDRIFIKQSFWKK